MSPSARRLLRLGGLAASALAVAWIAFRFVEGGALDVLARVPVSRLDLALVLGASAIAYAISLSLLALVWWRLVAALAASAPPALPIAATYAVAQYGKYLPGNVAHYAIRHAWSRRYGLTHAGLGLASVLEASLLLIAALGLTLLADTRALRGLSMLDPRLAIALLVAMIVALGVALRLARSGRFVERWHVPALPPPATLVLCLVCCVAFFVIAAALIDALAHALGVDVPSFAMLLAASAASWAAGFVVIGAPGGLGVREVAFVALAGGAIGETRALLLIGLFRVVTFLGDTLLFAAGALVLRRVDSSIAHSKQHHRSAP